MSVTRGAEVPAGTAHLFQALNRCCEGHSTEQVIEASVNLVVAAINHHTQLSGGGATGADAMAEMLASRLPELVRRQWDRIPSESDVKVPLNGN